jgi:tetratricopeptide (TPR) repeat protein
MSLAELSTFYIHTEKYLKATKCFSIIISLLDRLEYSAKHQLVSQSLTWLFRSKKENSFDNVKIRGIHNEFVKPFWGMYNNPTYIAPEASKLTTNYMLAETLNIFEEYKRANNVYKKIINNDGNKTLELSSKYLSLINLISYSISTNNYKDLLFCFEHFVPILNRLAHDKDLEFPSKSLESPQKDPHGAIKFFFIDHIKVKYVKKYEELGMFTVVEKFFIKLVEILKGFEFDFVDKIFAEITSAFGWLYGFNFSLNKNNRDTSLSWLTVSNEKALPNGMMEVFFNNKNMELFYIPVIHDLRKYLNDVFEYLFLAKDHFENKEIMDALLNSFKNFIKMMHNDNATSKDLKILQTIKDSLKSVGIPNIKHEENFVFLVIGFLKNRLLINYDKLKVIIFYQFLLENLSSIHKPEIDEIIIDYFSLHKELIRKNISNNQYIKSSNEEMNRVLNRFITRKGNLISPDIITKIESKIEKLSKV